MPYLEIIVPTYNEEMVIGLFIKRINEIFNNVSNSQKWNFGLTIVDDGSSDSTLKVIKEQDCILPLTVISLSRNFGHQSAVWAGIENVPKKKHIVVMDADLQDDPKLIHQIVSQFEKGFEVVLMNRKIRKDSLFKRFTALIFYKTLKKVSDNQLAPNIGDFFGLSPKSRIALLQHKEVVKYLRGLIQTLGYPTSTISYRRDSRKAGNTHYPLRKMIRLAVSGLTGFSISPLIWIAYFSVIASFMALGLIFYVLYLRFFSVYNLPAGWTFSIIATLVMCSSILLSLGVISLYLSRLILEAKQRPIYLTSDIHKINPAKKRLTSLQSKKELHS